MKYVSPVNTESTRSIINSFSDMMQSRLEAEECEMLSRDEMLARLAEQECGTFSRDELSANDLLAAFDAEVICLRQAVLMLRDSADDDSSQAAILDCATAVGVATVRLAYSLGNL